MDSKILQCAIGALIVCAFVVTNDIGKIRTNIEEINAKLSPPIMVQIQPS